MTDSDWANFLKTRKPTSGGVIYRGGRLLKHWSSTQSTIALSAAEAGLIVLVKGGTEALGI